MAQTIKIYVDMDGVVADWNKQRDIEMSTKPKFLSLQNKLQTAENLVLDFYKKELEQFKATELANNQGYDILDQEDLTYNFVLALKKSSKNNDCSLLSQYLEARKEQRRYIDIAVSNNFFQKIPVFGHVDYLMELVSYYDPVPCFLTSPMGEYNSSLEHNCRRCKFQWLSYHLSSRYSFNFLCVKKKEEFACQEPDTVKVLIDDRYKNLKPWLDAGGIPILFKPTKPEESIKNLYRLLEEHK